MAGTASASAFGRRFTPSAHQARNAITTAASTMCDRRQRLRAACSASSRSIAPAGAAALTRLLHLPQIELQRRCDFPQRVIVLVARRVEARDRAHLAERKVLDAEERFADFLLHIFR